MARMYSAKERADTLALYAVVGLAETARQTGIPKPTVASWVTRAGLPHTDSTRKTEAATAAAESRAKQLRVDLRLKLLEKAVDLLDRMDAPHVEFKGKDVTEVEYPIAPAAAVQNYATSVGILIDKYRLEMGEATDRMEHKTLTEGMDDHERATLRSVLDAALQAADSVAEGDPV